MSSVVPAPWLLRRLTIILASVAAACAAGPSNEQAQGLRTDDSLVLGAIFLDVMGASTGDSWDWSEGGPLVVGKTSSPLESLMWEEHFYSKLRGKGWTIVDEITPSIAKRNVVESALPIDLKEWGERLKLEPARRGWTISTDSTLGSMVPTLPGYSEDRRWALVLANILPVGILRNHGACGAYLLEHSGNGWVVRERVIEYGF